MLFTLSFLCITVKINPLLCREAAEKVDTTVYIWYNVIIKYRQWKMGNLLEIRYKLRTEGDIFYINTVHNVDM